MGASVRPNPIDDALQNPIDAALKKPRGYRTPEQVERLNRNDMARVRDALGPWETIAGGAAAAGQGRLFGWGDELAAAVRRPFSDKSYKTLLDEARLEQDIFAQEHPKADIALNIAGGALTKPWFAGRGFLPAAKNAAVMGGVAGAGYADGGLADRVVGAGVGAGTGLTVAGILGGVGAAARGVGAVVRRVRETPEEKAVSYLRKLAESRGADADEGFGAIQRDIAVARSAGGQPILAEGVGDAGVRGLLSATEAPLSTAKGLAHDVLAKRGATVLPRADEAALSTVGLSGMKGVRGPEYLNDWIEAIRRDQTAPLFLRAQAEAAAKEGAAGKAAAKFMEFLEKANIKALPGPGQSTVAGKGYPDPARLFDRPPENVPATDTPLRFPMSDPRTVGQDMAIEGLNTLRGPRQVVLRAANDVNVRNPEYVAPPAPAVPARSAVDEARDLMTNNAEVRSVIRELQKNPDYAQLLKDAPTSYEGLKVVYNGLNARLRDLKGGTARARNTEGAIEALTPHFLRAQAEIAPTARAANTAYAKLSQPKESFAFGLEFDKATPETLDKAIQTGFLPDGSQGSIESIRLGVVQRLRELLVKRASSQDLAGVARGKDPLAGMNSEQINRQLKAALGKKYEAIIPALRQLLKEEGTRLTVHGGGAREGVVPEATNVADIFSAFSGGLGFGAQAAARRTAAAAIKGTLKERAAVGFGKGADARAKMLLAMDDELDEWIRKARKPKGVPWEERVTGLMGSRGTGLREGRVARGATTGLLSRF